MTAIPLPILPTARRSSHVPPAPSGGHPTLVERLLADQQDLTAVARFARAHDAGSAGGTDGRVYRDLLPTAAPAPGQQYAFEVDLDACTGCKACVTACHNRNGLDDDETWRSVGLLVGDAHGRAVTQHVTTACHHCLDPACLDGCPVLAYEKDPVTGIVRHLDDQCIGCQYCVLKCPYDVPKYNARLGIVRKCDMCAGRLAVGEAPACVQGCPNGAIRITTVGATAARAAASRGAFLPATPAPDYTAPTTVYRSRRPLPADARAGDDHVAAPQHVHGSLVAMLVLTQAAVGVLAAGPLAGDAARRPLAVAATVVGVVGLNAALLHLGRPLYAFRAFLGLRTSWLSREVVAFGGFAKLAVAYAGLMWLGWAPSLHAPLFAGVVGAGLVAVLCSAMLYHDTRRPFWHARRTVPRFLGSTVVLGLYATCLAAALWPPSHGATGTTRALLVATIIAGAAKLAAEWRLTRIASADRVAVSLARSAVLLRGALRRMTATRFAVGAVGLIVLPATALVVAGPAQITALLAVGLVLALVGELVERALFFAAVVPLRMPGGAV